MNNKMYGYTPLFFDPEEYGIAANDIKELITKIAKKAKLTARDNQLLRKIEQAHIKHFGELYIERLPKKRYCELSGRQPKVVNEQAVRYGLPAIGKPTVNLQMLLYQIHEFLAKIAHRFADDEDLTDGANSPWLEKLREKKAKQEAIRLNVMRKQYLPSDFFWKFMASVANQIRKSLFQLEKRYGEEAKLIVEEMLEDVCKETEQSLDPASYQGPLLEEEETDKRLKRRIGRKPKR